MPHLDEGRLTAWLDGALGPSDAAGAETARHLEACADCRRRLQEARELRERTQAILAAADVPVGPAPGFERIAARARNGATSVDAGGARRRRPNLSSPGLAWAASLALAVTAGWLARDLSLRRGGTVPPFADAPAVQQPGSMEKAPMAERLESGRGKELPAGDGVAPRRRQEAPAAAPRTAGEGERRDEAAAVEAPEEAAFPVAPETVPSATVAAEADPFDEPPYREAGDLAVQPEVSGCWESDVGPTGLPARIRLTSATGIADEERAGAEPRPGLEAGIVMDAEGAIVARWTGFGTDSVWIGGVGPETQRLRFADGRLVGLARPRAQEGATRGAATDSGRVAEPARVAWRRVPCEP